MQSLSKEMKQGLFDQITKEYSNCLVYWSMEWALRAQALKGMACWMHEQGSDERHHGKKFAYYLIDRGETPPLAVAEPTPPTFYGKSPLDIFSAALDLERKTSKDIENLVSTSEADSDYETRAELEWFVNEQIDEEKSLLKIIKKLKDAGSDYAAILKLNDKLG